MTVALQGGLVVETGMAKLDDFKKSLNSLKVDLQLYSPVPKTIILQENSEYQMREYQVHANVDAKVSGLNDIEEKTYQIQRGGPPVQDLYIETAILKRKAANFANAAIELKSQCKDSEEWKKLERDCQILECQPGLAITELTREENGDDPPTRQKLKFNLGD